MKKSEIDLLLKKLREELEYKEAELEVIKDEVSRLKGDIGYYSMYKQCKIQNNDKQRTVKEG